MDEQAQVVYGYVAATQSYDITMRFVRRLIDATSTDEARRGRFKRVLIKADFSIRPDGSVRTDPSILRAVAEYYLIRGATVTIGDSPLDSCLRESGLLSRREVEQLLCDLPITVLSFEEEETVACVTERRVLYAARSAIEADHVVNLASFRDDVACKPFGCIANMVGCVPGYQKAKLLLETSGSSAFAHLAVELLSAISPSVSILVVPTRTSDGRPGNVVCASSDAVALDALGCRIVLNEDEQAELIRIASDAGLGIGWPEAIRECYLTSIPSGIRYLPEKTDSRVSRWPRGALGMVAPFIWARPQFLQEDCPAECDACVSSCPTGALEFIDSRHCIEVRSERCVGCWRCREVCPSDSISIARSSLAARLLV